MSTIPADSGATVPTPRANTGSKAAPGQGWLMSKMSIQDAPGWLVSVGVHLVIMVLLLLVKFHTRIDAGATFLNAFEDIENELPFDATDTDQVGVGAEVTSLSPTSTSTPASVAAQNNAAPSAQQQTEAKVNESFKSPQVRIDPNSEYAMPTDVELTQPGTKDGPLTGGGTEYVEGGVESAIDRLTWEITQTLHQNKTTVIWLFDQSLSLKERRDAIADRFENVYRQLESLEEGGKGALQTVAATYGSGFKLLTEKPVEDVKTLIPKVRAIEDDPSGKENVFAAVNQLAQKFKGERAKKRSVMILIITDEKGDDAEKSLEETIMFCRKQGIKVYCVGNAALFGARKGTSPGNIPIRRPKTSKSTPVPKRSNPRRLRWASGEGTAPICRGCRRVMDPTP